jgi:hypothetical protein
MRVNDFIYIMNSKLRMRETNERNTFAINEIDRLIARSMSRPRDR